jgi:hypothetical protein
MQLRAQLQTILGPGLSADPLQHAGQVARVAAVLHEAFMEAGLRSTVVGGSAIELHAPGVYLSGDLDLVVERIRPDAGSLESVFASLGFQRYGRHWTIGDLFVEVPSTRLSDPAEWMRVGSALLRVVTKEVVVADRIIGFRQWGVLAYGQQAIDLLAAFGDELDDAWLQEKLQGEGSEDALDPLHTLARGDAPVTDAVLRDVLARLRQRRPA